jgi:hypothetical protein
MTKTIKSYTSSAHYFLTIDDETGLATGCACPDRTFRHHECKHITDFNREIRRAEKFAELWSALDFRSAANKAARREAYCIDFAIYG